MNMSDYSTDDDTSQYPGNSSSATDIIENSFDEPSGSTNSDSSKLIESYSKPPRPARRNIIVDSSSDDEHATTASVQRESSTKDTRIPQSNRTSKTPATDFSEDSGDNIVTPQSPAEVKGTVENSFDETSGSGISDSTELIESYSKPPRPARRNIIVDSSSDDEHATTASVQRESSTKNTKTPQRNSASKTPAIEFSEDSDDNIVIPQSPTEVKASPARERSLTEHEKSPASRSEADGKSEKRSIRDTLPEAEVEIPIPSSQNDRFSCFNPSMNSTIRESLGFQQRPLAVRGTGATPKRHPEVVDFATPRSAAKEVLSDSDSDESDAVQVVIDEDNDDVYEVEDSFQSTSTVIRQPSPTEAAAVTRGHLLPQLPKHHHQQQQQQQKEVKGIPVNAKTYADQRNKIRMIQEHLSRNENILRTLNIQALPDKGRLIMLKTEQFRKNLVEERKKLEVMVISEEIPEEKPKFAWDNIHAGVDAVQPETFGKKGLARYNAEKAMTMDRLKEIHGSMASCPTDNDLAEDPKNLKVQLMPHQKRAVAWLMWRESQKPSGGILADDMGLGKTLTLISLVMKIKENDPNENLSESDDDQEEKEKQSRRYGKYHGGTLIICPASVLNQWAGEIQNRTKRGILGYELHHGAKRETKPRQLAKHDVVLTTYSIVMNEFERDGVLFKIKWRRIVLDEAHQIRNHASKTSQACCSLGAKSRWALTGTPVHNKELDMYALLKFLRCSPFDDLHVWKRWVADKSTGGQERLHAVVSTIMLRRTKAELMQLGKLESLPSKEWQEITVVLDDEEMKVYQKVLLFSKTLFAQFLHQRAEKRHEYMADNNQFPKDPNADYHKMRQILLKMNKIQEVKQTDILVLLLRLRQICCHPSLITQMLQGDEELGTAEDQENVQDINLLEQLNKLALEDDDAYKGDNGPPMNLEESIHLKQASRGFLNPSNPVFASDRRSTKMESLIKLFKERVPEGDKAIIVSQWRSLLDLIAVHLRAEAVPFGQLDGTIPVPKRQPIVDAFNNPKNKMRVLLLSLTAGGVGLNLVGGNHLLLFDIHWNPQLESQAQDRIYRMGQTKPVFIYKFMTQGTIEERIKDLQQRKLQIAESLLSGSKQTITNKLSLDDLKLLFS